MKTARARRPSHTLDKVSIRETFRLAQHGSESAFELLYRLHCKRVYALCLRMAGVKSEAEDLTQEVFLQVFRKIQTFRGKSAFSSWLHRLTGNIVLTYFRNEKLLSTSLEDLNPAEEETTSRRYELAAVDVRLAGLFDRLDFQIAVNGLPEDCKVVFLLHDVQGYEHDEIAKLLGLSIRTSKTQLYIARTRLRCFFANRATGHPPIWKNPETCSQKSVTGYP